MRFLSFSLVLCTGVLLLFSLISSAALGAVKRSMNHPLPLPVFFLESVDFIFWCGVITLLLAAIFKLLPDAEIAWHDVWIGAAIASLLFTTGKVLIGLYLAGSAVTSAYGAVSSLLLVLVWIYYSAQIVLFGAEITHVYANKHSLRVESAFAHFLEGNICPSPPGVSANGSKCSYMGLIARGEAYLDVAFILLVLSGLSHLNFRLAGTAFSYSAALVI
jgi:uncharacterized BrkB/YihY/UPF0761 family membrane protein